jgi:hypothetical protein
MAAAIVALVIAAVVAIVVRNSGDSPPDSAANSNAESGDAPPGGSTMPPGAPGEGGSPGATATTAAAGAESDTRPDALPASVPAAGKYTYRVEGQSQKQTRTYSEATPTDRGRRQRVTLGSTENDRPGISEEFTWSASRVTLDATIFPGPPDAPPRECRWDPPLEALKLPVAAGQQWRTSSRCVTEDQHSTTTMERAETVKVTERDTVTVAGRALPCLVVERQTTTRSSGQFKGSVSTNSPPPPPTEMKTTTVSCFSVDHLIPLREVTEFESNASVGAQRFKSELYLESTKPA